MIYHYILFFKHTLLGIVSPEYSVPGIHGIHTTEYTEYNKYKLALS